MRSSSSIIEQPPPKNCCEWWMRFISAEAAWTFALVFTYLLFFVLAVPDFAKFGYSDDKKANDGGIQSGPSGSGLFIVSLLLFLCCTFTYGMKLVRCARARRRARLCRAMRSRAAAAALRSAPRRPTAHAPRARPSLISPRAVLLRALIVLGNDVFWVGEAQPGRGVELGDTGDGTARGRARNRSPRVRVHASCTRRGKMRDAAVTTGSTLSAL